MIECDRCHRPVACLSYRDMRVVLDGPRIDDGGADTSPYWQGLLNGRQAHAYASTTSGRAGAFIVDAEQGYGLGRTRDKLICIGRKHPRYERVVSAGNALLAYAYARSTGRDRLGMRDVSAGRHWHTTGTNEESPGVNRG